MSQNIPNKNISINYSTCKGSQCLQCIKVCPHGILIFAEGKVIIATSSKSGCISCGHCMALCPQDAISIKNCKTETIDLQSLDSSFRKNFEIFLKSRRSIRFFKDTPVSQQIFKKILSIAQYCPSGSMPSNVELLIVRGKSENTTNFSYLTL